MPTLSILRSFTFGAILLLLVFCLPATAAQSQRTPERAVAILYDDSGSMGPNGDNPKRWIYADQAVQTMIALLDENDELYWYTMTAGKRRSFQPLSQNIDNAIKNFRGLNKPILNQAGIQGFYPLTEELKSSKAKNKWFIIVTDAFIKTKDSPQIAQDVENFKNAKTKANVRFVLIEPEKDPSDSNYLAGYWLSELRNDTKISTADPAQELPVRLEEISSELVNRDFNGIKSERSGNKITVNSALPLTGVVLFIQKVDPQRPISVNQVYAKLGKSADITKRFHEIKSPVNEQNVNELGYVIHLTSKKMISAKDKPSAEITFPYAFDDNVKIKVFPNVAKKITTVVYDDGKIAPKNAQGAYEVCESSPAVIRTTLQDLAGNTISTSQNMQVILEGRKNYRAKYQSNGRYFEAKIFHKDFKQQALELVPNSTYKGYFENDKSDPITIVSKFCPRNIALQIVSGADGNDWQHEVDQLDKAEPVILEVLVEGKKATEAEMKDFQLDLPDDIPWTIEADEKNGRFILNPKSECCAFFWMRPNLIDKTTLTIKRENLSPSMHDKMLKPLSLTYAITRPDDDYRYYWWKYGCPIAFWGAVLLILWYIKRILGKERFLPKTYIHYERKGMSRHKSELLVKSRGFIKRWLWPSKSEIRVIEGVAFAAIGKRGTRVRILGKTLDNNFKIARYQFSQGLQDRGKPQLDVEIQPSMSFYHLDENRNRDMRMQYSHNYKPDGIEWEEPL